MIAENGRSTTDRHFLRRQNGLDLSQRDIRLLRHQLPDQLLVRRQIRGPEGRRLPPLFDLVVFFGYEVRVISQLLRSFCRANMSSADQPLVSVVVPTHKRLPYLTETVQAILAQSYPKLELLIVADGHDQDVANFVLDLQDPRAKYLACPPGGRPSVPRNFGIHHANGAYIAFCDDDDLWHRDKIQKQIALMLKERLDFTFTACSNIDQNGNRIDDCLLGNFGRVGKTKFLLSLGGMIYNSSLVVSRSLLNKSGLFDEVVSLRCGEDYEICSRMLMHTDGVGIREPLVGYRSHVGSIQPQTVSDWMRLQARLQSAILANGSATIWLWLGRYLRVLYWASRTRLRRSLRR
jgi:teichuronic acid biosynthesis glycosyltransferase TuaG